MDLRASSTICETFRCDTVDTNYFGFFRKFDSFMLVFFFIIICSDPLTIRKLIVDVVVVWVFLLVDGQVSCVATR